MLFCPIKSPYILSNLVQEVLQEKVAEGSWSPHGQNDMLTCVLGKKEHGGRVRGVGGIAGIREVFGPEKSTQNRG